MNSFLKRGVKLTSSGKDDRKEQETRVRDALSVGFHSRGWGSHCSIFLGRLIALPGSVPTLAGPVWPQKALSLESYEGYARSSYRWTNSSPHPFFFFFFLRNYWLFLRALTFAVAVSGLGGSRSLTKQSFVEESKVLWETRMWSVIAALVRQALEWFCISRCTVENCHYLPRWSLELWFLSLMKTK